MDVEKAVALLEDQMSFNRTMQRGWGNSMIETDAGSLVNGELYANQHKDVADALELAINALRAGGKGMNVPTKPDGQPLTLENLRWMDGQCVKVVVDGVEPLVMLALVEVPKDEDCVLLRNNLGGVSEFYIDDDLREDGVKVYAYQPAPFDREAWTSEWINSMPVLGAGDLETRCKSCGNLVLFETDFCPYCGKAMTEEAWAELEKRVRGVKYHGA